MTTSETVTILIPGAFLTSIFGNLTGDGMWNIAMVAVWSSMTVAAAYVAFSAKVWEKAEEDNGPIMVIIARVICVGVAAFAAACALLSVLQAVAAD